MVWGLRDQECTAGWASDEQGGKHIHAQALHKGDVSSSSSSSSSRNLWFFFLLQKLMQVQPKRRQSEAGTGEDIGTWQIANVIRQGSTLCPPSKTGLKRNGFTDFRGGPGLWHLRGR